MNTVTQAARHVENQAASQIASRASQAAPSRAVGRMREAEARRKAEDFVAASGRLRRSKLLFGLVLGVLFWFSVPYHVPEHKPGAAINIAVADNAEQFGGNASRQIAVPLIGLVCLYLLWRLPRRTGFAGRLRWAVAGYLLWLASSTLWSDDPTLTAKRLVVFGTDALCAYTLAVSFTAMELALWAMLTTCSVALLSLFADIFILRLFAPLDPDYRLTGVMTANYQAMNLLVCCLCTAALMLRRPRWMPWLSVVLVMALALLLLTRSRVAVLLALGLVAIVLLRIAKERLAPAPRAMVFTAVLAVLVPTLVYVGGKDLRGAAQGAFMMGRNDSENTGSLSNRLPLWTELLTSVEQRPWLGFGYGDFWNEARADQISRDQGWAVPNAHNTYLDQVLILGWPGGVLYTGILFAAVVLAWRRYRAGRTPGDLLNALLLTWMAMLSTAESTPLEPHLPTLMAYVALVRMCCTQTLPGAESTGDEPILERLVEASSSPVEAPDVPNSPAWRRTVFPECRARLRHG